MKLLNRLTWVAIAWLFASIVLSGSAQAQIFNHWEKVQACPGIDPSKGFWTRNGAESGSFTDQFIKDYAEQLGYQARIYDYAPEVENILGLEQRPYLIHLKANLSRRNLKGTFLYFHGGGGDRGYVDNFGRVTDPNSTAAMAVFWLQSGYDVVLVEYPRGWMNPQWCDECPFNTSDQAYARQEAAAKQSFRHARLAVEFAHRKSRSPNLILSGTSFGGAIVCYLTMMAEPGWPEAMGIQAAMNGYGGVLASDPVTDTSVPVLFVGGLDDALVPADGGHFYHSYRAIQGDGVRSSYERYVKAGGPGSGVFSAGAATGRGYQPIGHTYGLFHNDLEVQVLFLDFIKNGRQIFENRRLTVDRKGRPAGYEIFGGEHTPSPDIPNCN